MERIAITGSSGYLGRRLVTAFRTAGMTVLGIDVSPATEDVPDQFHQGDVRDATLLEVLRDFRPDTIIHSAFVIKQMRDGSRMSDINVGGTKNMVRLVEKLAPERFLFFSSATAMGAWPDNPVPIPEDAKPRARKEYQYAAEKAALESDMLELAAKNPQIAVSWVRPCVVGGPRMDNFLSRFIFGMPVLMKLDGKNHQLQFVHEDDVVGAIQAILSANGRGSFNLGPPNHTTVADIARHTKRRVIPVPFWMAYAAGWVAWKSRFWLSEGPPGFLYFVRHPWIVAPDRLVDEIGYQFRFTSTETLIGSFRNQ